MGGARKRYPTDVKGDEWEFVIRYLKHEYPRAAGVRTLLLPSRLPIAHTT